ncbi:MAG: hypothetical protein RI973_2360 [Bacteroidota bacterium]|jgi:hypothetical protein
MKNLKKFLLALPLALLLFSCKNDGPATQNEETATTGSSSVSTSPEGDGSSNPQNNNSPAGKQPGAANNSAAGDGVSQDGIYETISAVDTTSGNVYKKLRAIKALSTAIPPNPTKKTDPVKPAYNRPSATTPQQQRVVRVLTDKYWSVYALVKIGDKEANRQNQGTWFKFKEDGSYDYGYYGEKIGSGAWSFDGMKATLLLDSELLGDDREWTLKMSTSEDIMVWVGTERFANNNLQLKLQKYAEIPKSRDEMGFDKQ